MRKRIFRIIRKFLLGLLVLILIVSVGGAIVLNMETFGKLPQGEAFQQIQASPNHNGEKFVNSVETNMDMDMGKLSSEYMNSDSEDREPPRQIPIEKIHYSSPDEIPSTALRIAWLGHASAIIEFEGKRILIDPVFSNRVSPFGWMGPKRFHESPLQLKDLPHIDAIVISHNHYDHLDHPSIVQLKERDIHYMVPLAVGASLQHWGIKEEFIHEFDWHDSYDLDGVSIIATPARHFSNRGITDRNKTLWASWIMKGDSTNVYFSGDSGIFPGFEDIGDQYGPFDVSLIGIGAYNKLWQAIHTNPEEAIQAHIKLRAEKLLPVHWCTFDLALHSWAEPIERLVKSAEAQKVSLILPKPGQWVDVQDWEQKGYWWRAR